VEEEEEDEDAEVVWPLSLWWALKADSNQSQTNVSPLDLTRRYDKSMKNDGSEEETGQVKEEQVSG
jgi:hypothetical protein